MGRIKAAMWQNKTDNSIRYVTVGRLYRDGNDWKRDDLPVSAKITDQAHTFIFQKQ